MPLSAFAHVRATATAPLADQSSGTVPGGDDLVQPRAGRVARRRRRRRSRTPRRRIGMPPSVQAVVPGHGAAFQASLTNEPLLILAALVTVYIVLGVLYESYIHPLTILSTLPSAGVGAILALLLTEQELGVDRADRHHPADRHREEERDHDDRLRARGRAEHGSRAARGDLSGVPAALPADHDDDDGGAARRAAAGAGLGHRRRAAAAARHHDRRRPARQPVLTLYTTPVSISRSSGWRDVRAPPRGASAGARGATSYEPLRAVHPPARRDDAARRSALALAGALAFAHAAGLAAAAGRLSRPSSCSAALPGASPETMASAVATPLERQFGRIAGVTEMTSSSSLGIDDAWCCSSI